MLAMLAPQTGCYYGHLARGQMGLLMSSRDVEDVIADPETEAGVRAKLELVGRVRDFAAQLGLEVDDQYTSYVHRPGDRIITSIVVTEPRSLEARPFRFPIIGSVPYKGFFDQARAEREAEALRAEGLDVCVSGIRAYSTLGWFDDPLTTPMLRSGEGALVETILHELVHATVFVKSQPAFNESVASFIGKRGSLVFYARDERALERRRSEIEDAAELARLLAGFRERVEALYASAEPDSSTVLDARAALERQMRASIRGLPWLVYDAEKLAERIRLGDACLALRGTYSDDGPKHSAVLEALGGDLRLFIEALRAAADSRDPRAEFFRIATAP